MVSLPIPAMILISVSTQNLVAFGPPIALLVHDLRTLRRLERATLWGLSAYCVMMIGARVVSSTPIGHAVVTLMGG